MRTSNFGSVLAIGFLIAGCSGGPGESDVKQWRVGMSSGRLGRLNEERLVEIWAMMTLCEQLQPEKLVIHASFEPVPEGEREQRFSCDTNHLLQETTEEFIRTVGGEISTLHVAEYDGIDERHWLPGHEEGVITWAR